MADKKTGKKQRKGGTRLRGRSHSTHKLQKIARDLGRRDRAGRLLGRALLLGH